MKQLIGQASAHENCGISRVKAPHRYTKILASQYNFTYSLWLAIAKQLMLLVNVAIAVIIVVLAGIK